MIIELELWHLITLLLSFFGAVAGFGKVLLGQFEKRLTERFKALDEAREIGSKQLRESLQRHMDQEAKTIERLQGFEREFLSLKAELPLHYVRREDYIRGQSVIEAKLDAVYNKLELVQMKGKNNA